MFESVQSKVDVNGDWVAPRWRQMKKGDKSGKGKVGGSLVVLLRQEESLVSDVRCMGIEENCKDQAQKTTVEVSTWLLIRSCFKQ